VFLLPLRRFAKRVLPPKVRGGIRKALYPFTQIAILIRGRAATMGRKARRLLFLLPFPFFLKYQYPEFLSIFLTTRCNLRCFICRREGFKGEDFNYENLRKLEKAIKYARTIDLTGWGEPLLYPRFEDVLNYIYSLNPRKSLIQITTNGTKLSEHLAKSLSGHLKSLIISLNAATVETYNREMKYGNFEETLSSIRAFLSGLEESKRRKVQLHFVAHTENFREIPEFVALAKALGISNVSIGQYLVSIAAHSKYTLLHVKDEYNAVVDQAKDLGDKLGVQLFAPRFYSERGLNSQDCQSPFKECFIEVNGDIRPCCFCGNYRMGNAYETNFETVWFGEAYHKLRKKRYLLACNTCMPFIPFDNYKAHFTAYFKETPEFEKIELNSS
jgi:MoaA/NifB/PqqE/SkfB family radical SAM enzyme